MTALKPEALEDRAQRIFEELIPGLTDRCRKFRVDTSEIDEEMLLLFREHISALVASIVSAAGRESAPDVRRDAHSLLGMGGTIGVPSLSVVAEDLSSCAKQGDYRGCLELVEGLQKWERDWVQQGRSES